MNQQSDNAKPGGKIERIVLAMAAVFLVVTFLRRLSPVPEMPSDMVKWLSIAFDLGMAVGVVGLGARVRKSLPRRSGARGGWMALTVAGTLAAAGIFAIHLRGGPRVELPPRPGQSGTKASVFPRDLQLLGERMGTVMTAYQQAEAAALKTRWQNTPRAEHRKLPREALHEHIARQRDLVAATDRVLEMLTEPGFEANVARFVSIAEAHGARLPDADLTPDAWHLLRRIYAGSYQLYVLVDKNWDDWLKDSTFSPDHPQIWRREALALVRDMQAADKEKDALIAANGAAPPVPTATPNPQQAEFARLKAELKTAHALHERRRDELAATRWAQTINDDPQEGRNYLFAAMAAGAVPKLRKLSRDDFNEYREAQRLLLESQEQVLSLFRAAQAKGFDPFNVGVDLGGWHRKPETWRAAEKVYRTAYAQTEVLEQNWQDWQRNGLPRNGTKPWHKRARQLQTEFNTVFAEWDASR